MKRSAKELLSGMLILGGGGLAAWGIWQMMRKQLPSGAQASTQQASPPVATATGTASLPIPTVPTIALPPPNVAVPTWSPPGGGSILNVPIPTGPSTTPPTVTAPAIPTSSVSTAPTQTVDLPAATAPEIQAAEDAISKLLMGMSPGGNT